jgi:hypothetical protein
MLLGFEVRDGNEAIDGFETLLGIIGTTIEGDVTFANKSFVGVTPGVWLLLEAVGADGRCNGNGDGDGDCEIYTVYAGEIMNVMGFPCSTPTGGIVLGGLVTGALDAFGVVIVAGVIVFFVMGDAVTVLTIFGVVATFSEPSGGATTKTGNGFLFTMAVGEDLTSSVTGEIVVIDNDDTTGAAVLVLAVEVPCCVIGCNVGRIGFVFDEVNVDGACVLLSLAGYTSVGARVIEPVLAFVRTVSVAVVATGSSESDERLLRTSKPPMPLLGDGDGDNNATVVVSSLSESISLGSFCKNDSIKASMFTFSRTYL